MATWTTIANTAVDVDSPVTVSLVTALRDNPEAIAEGSDNAPKISAPAMGIVLSSGNITTAAAVTITGLDRVDKVLDHYRLNVFDDTGGANTTGTYRYRTSTDGGSTWSGYTTLKSETASEATLAFSDWALIDVSGSINALELSATTDNDAVSVDHVTLGVEGTSP